ncbi:ATP-binding protein [Glycomyces luteolus]|uniref:ATP-binding protein n=1 Tax=Glycomyces luteolus TaxID=2670330 RepID=A0A9X3P8N0_9ACTN|nr:AAA family ATPase [Glycomyces luteolus]MDA1360144.1 ATP-binding protein [Glycomyces luteolus]
MIVWLNGNFGAGKTTTARLLKDTLPARVFDSEHIGYLLRPIIGDIPCHDFKEWAPWRGLTIETARQVLDFVGGTLVIPQSVLQHGYWTELTDGFAKADIPVRAFTLHADRDTFRHRVEHDTDEPTAKQWRLDHRERYETALDAWMRDHTEIIDTSHLTPDQVAAHITTAVTG